jgi:rod shape determining protein RodA
MPKNFRSSYSIDWFSFILTCIIASIGLIFVFSATYTPPIPYSIFFKKQCIGIALGIIAYWCFAFIDYHTLMRSGYFAYFVVIGLLFFTLIKGSIGMGAQRWFNLFFFKMQPSELAKPLFSAFVAHYFFTHHNWHKYTIKDFIPLLITLSISFFLIAKQPDSHWQRIIARNSKPITIFTRAKK